ncbi:MAG: PLDc N-terminal domain-containing protein [Candidatus Limnocylindria bacterium]
MGDGMRQLKDAQRKSSTRVKFSELSVRRRVGIVLLGAIQLGLLIAAQVDIQRRPAAEVNGSRAVWRLVCLVNFVGPLSYFRWGRRNEDRATG